MSRRGSFPRDRLKKNPGCLRLLKQFSGLTSDRSKSVTSKGSTASPSLEKRTAYPRRMGQKSQSLEIQPSMDHQQPLLQPPLLILSEADNVFGVSLLSPSVLGQLGPAGLSLAAPISRGLSSIGGLSETRESDSDGRFRSKSRTLRRSKTIVSHRKDNNVHFLFHYPTCSSRRQGKISQSYILYHRRIHFVAPTVSHQS